MVNQYSVSFKSLSLFHFGMPVIIYKHQRRHGENEDIADNADPVRKFSEENGTPDSSKYDQCIIVNGYLPGRRVFVGSRNTELPACSTKAEDGMVPLEFADMTESDSEDYRFRTRWNAEHSDATLFLSFSPMLEGGTLRTRQYCMNARKPYFVDNPSSPALFKGKPKVADWLAKVCKKNGGAPIILNVAGPRESKSPGIAEATENYVSRLIENEREVNAK